ncbi:potassium-transporting ATPase subunit KdpC [Hymenobacter gummosus]|uniref:Potassium-transporting ATPase KdpC subunit n=1 Tax=Hymenobacter gummosus TaxID=1776032 RepID=A0A431U5X7_9BACT|nr:potassium-transporting ATPase subunit KdpC [Hymenobacter gummosus]RTQ51712.1 potassium-transporting ATPase subunit KdpC [Hymenobacter gummosus]
MKLFRQSLILTLLLIVLCSVLYPLAILGIARLAPGAGEGQTLSRHGRVVGYARLGQRFQRPEYFHSRPSAVDYNAAGSAGSNKAPSNPEYQALVRARLDTFLRQNPGVQAAEVPAELLTASGSGLDPDLSPRGVLVQVARIARLRGVEAEKLRALVQQQTESPLLGLLGPARVNVLRLNLALDELAPLRR